MPLPWKKSPHMKEWESLMRQEAKLRKKRLQEQTPFLEERLEGKVPEKLEETLRRAFSKAFTLVLEKGTTVIEKTYSREKRAQSYEGNIQAAQLRGDRKSLQVFSAAARRKNRHHTLAAGVEGVSLGLLGIGLPDIPLFCGLLLRSIYETAMSFGFSYDNEEERRFILHLIEASLQRGEPFVAADLALNHWIDWGKYPLQTFDAQLARCAQALSSHLLYMKFIQGIPLVGAVGGLSDSICLHRVSQYAYMKYRRRFLRQGMPLQTTAKLD